jgi:hypothetical protein
MPIGFAIFITALLVSVIVLLIYHYVIIGTSDGNNGGGPGGYNYDMNIQYLNTLASAMAATSQTPLNSQLNYDNGQNFPAIPSGADKFKVDLS